MKILAYSFLVITLIAAIVLYLAWGWYSSSIQPGGNMSETVEFIVDEGEPISNILTRLEEQNIIQNALAAQIYIRIEGINPNVKFGNYSIQTNSSTPEVIALLEEGTFKPGILVTIKEGLRYEQIADQLQQDLRATRFSVSEFLDIVDNPDSYEFANETTIFLSEYKIPGNSLRGFLYPDTYEFANDVDAKSVVEKMVLNLRDRLNQNLNLNNSLGTRSSIQTLYDALILASVIEKEASAFDDRADISGVFHNRLENGIGLESDATVNFITGKNDPGVLISDTKIDSPYNTYLYTGLMPTPINNPRIESIVAALEPNETDYFFFFHTDDGQTFYSETFEEHSRKVNEFRGAI